MLMLIAAAAGLSVGSDGRAYGDWLLRWELSRNRQLQSLAIEVENSGKGHFEAGSRAGARSLTALPLADALGNRIGTVDFFARGHLAKAAAIKLAADLSRHIYSASGLAEPDPFVTGAVRSARAQQLIERELAREPRLVTIAFHVALGGFDNRIIASNFGRIGKPADADDQRVVASGAVLQEVTNGGKRLAVELPLRDRSGRTIGALSTSFTTGPGGEQAAYQSALRVQHDLSRAIPRLRSLAQ